MPKNRGLVFSQGDPATLFFYIQEGRSAHSRFQKQAGGGNCHDWGTGDFSWGGCLTGQPLRTASRDHYLGVLDHAGSKKQRYESYFTSSPPFRHVAATSASRTFGLRGSGGQLFNSSEKRLARVLLLLANFGKEGKPEPVIPKVSQETWRRFVGTTRSRVSFFMNRFRKAGFH